jgi:hypothetical protein
MFSVCATFVRWYLLVRALDLPFRVADAFRLSFVGYLLNFVAFGSVGGDLFKAVFLAREQHGRRTEAVATVFLDRALGLYSLLIVASAAILFSDQAEWDADIKVICNLTLAATLAGTAAITVVLLPGWDRSSLMKAMYRLPQLIAVQTNHQPDEDRQWQGNLEDRNSKTSFLQRTVLQAWKPPQMRPGFAPRPKRLEKRVRRRRMSRNEN